MRKSDKSTAPEAQADETSPMMLVYMPAHHDPAETAVNGVVFRAYEPVVLDQAQAGKVAHLDRNPYFGKEVDPERHAKWKLVREAEAAVEAAKARLDEAVKQVS
jgi:hypothetical protein